MENEPHPGLADSVPPNWTPMSDARHDPDEDRNHFIGVPGVSPIWNTFDLDDWNKNGGRFPFPPTLSQPPEGFVVPDPAEG